MTRAQEHAITLALNILHVGFFECPRQDFQYFINNDEWALLMSAAGVNAVGTPPQEIAVAVLRNAVARVGLFEGMTPFEPPAHYCSFLLDKVRAGERKLALGPCARGQTHCPYATFEAMKESQ
jgi:hypothetical protein